MREPESHPSGRAILALLDEELAPGDAEKVSAHCDTCEQCRQLREELSSVGETLRAHVASGPLRPVWPVVQDRLDRASRPILRAAFGVATAAAIVVGVFLGLLAGTAESRRAESGGANLWSVVGSSLGEGGSGTLSGAYGRMASEEGREGQ